MNYIAISIIIITFEVFCWFVYLDSFGMKKRLGFQGHLHFLITSITSYFIAWMLPNALLLRQVVIMLLFICVSAFRLGLPLNRIILLVMLFEGMSLAVDYVAYVINNYFVGTGEHHMYEIEIRELLTAVLGKVVLFVMALYVRRCFGKKERDVLIENEWIRLQSIPLITVTMIVAMLYTFQSVENRSQGNMLLIISCAMVVINVIAFYLVKDIAERNRIIRENDIFKVQVRNQAEMYFSISENYDKYKRRAHEYKNQITCIDALLKKELYEQATAYIESIYGQLGDDTDLIDTNHVIINAIINTKYQEARDSEITMVFKVNDLSGLFVKDADVVTVLSNLIDNAICACKELRGERIIRIRIELFHDRLIISVENTTNGEVIIKNNQVIIDESSVQDGHGMGIHNVCKIIKKYQGHHVIRCQDGYFLFAILIPVS